MSMPLTLFFLLIYEIYVKWYEKQEPKSKYPCEECQYLYVDTDLSTGVRIHHESHSE